MELVIYLAKSAAILSMFYVVYFFFLRNDTLFTAKRFFFLFGIIASITLPFLEFTTIIEMEAPVVSSFTDYDNYLPVIQEQERLPIQQHEPLINWFQLGTIVYIAFIFFFLARFIYRIFSLRSLLKRHLYQKIGYYKYVKVNEAISPFSIFNYIVYNPKLHTEQELEMILQHEKIHAKQLHSLDILAGQLITTVQWINPFSWFYKKAMETNLEYIADSRTITQIESKKAYQLALINASSSFLAPALTSPFYQSLIKKRIVMLNKHTSHKRNLLKVSLVLPLLALFLFSFNVKEEIVYKERSVFSEPTKTEATILPTSTDKELDKIEAFYSKNKLGALIKIDNRKRDEEGLIISFDFQTKFDGQNKFYTRFSQNEPKDNSEETYKGHTLFFGNDKLHISEIGPKATSFTITSDTIAFKNLDFLTPNHTRNTPIVINAETTDDALNGFIDRLEAQSNELEIAFKDRLRNEAGQLVKFSIDTKFKGQPRFDKNVVYGTSEDPKIIPSLRLQVINNELYFGKADKVSQNKITQDGVVMVIEEMDINNQTNSLEKMGENPLYIINGEEMLKTALPKNVSFEVSEYIQMIYPKKATKKYGTKGKDGVILFKGTTIVIEETPVIKKDSINKSQGVHISEDKSKFNKTVSQKKQPKTSYYYNTNATTATLEYKYKITKNTTNTELETIKTAFSEKHNGSFNYKVKRNTANEIIAISIQYTDGDGNTGSYDVNQNGTSIQSIILYKNENGSGILSSGNQINKEELIQETHDRANEMKERMEEKRMEIEQRRRQIVEGTEVRINETEERIEQQRTQMKERRAKLEAQREVLVEKRQSLEAKVEEIIEISKSIERTNNKTNTAISNRSSTKEEIYITKNTTDLDL